jgi:hypothetical protein
VTDALVASGLDEVEEFVTKKAPDAIHYARLTVEALIRRAEGLSPIPLP